MFFLISPITFEFYDKTTFILKLFQWDIPDLFYGSFTVFSNIHTIFKLD